MCADAMDKEELGSRLIFLISQPRAGSTLLQRILGGHPDIHATSEPWLMLHPLYALRDEGYQAEYLARSARIGLREFLGALPRGEDEYLEGIRRMYGYLYERALEGSGKRYFLDKTPRYYSIIPDLYRVFPEARFMILLRNPLAVLSSVLAATKGNWYLLYRSRLDVTQAPSLLLEGIKQLNRRAVVVQYEKLVADPQVEVRRICDGLGVAFTPELIEYGGHDLPHWRFGDNTQVYQHSRPVAEMAEKWTTALADTQVWRLMNDYLHLLGQVTIEKMGYSYEALERVLEANRPGKMRLRFTFSMNWLLRKPPEQRKRWESGLNRLATSLLLRGFQGTIGVAVRKLIVDTAQPG